MATRFVPTQEPLGFLVAPFNTQLVALVELQLKVELPPYAIVVGDQLNEAVGTGGATVKLALLVVDVPPAPEQ